MPTPQERVASVVRFFFERALPQAVGKTFAQLTNPRVHVGAYGPYAGAPVATSTGQSLTPRFGLRVSPAVPVAGGLPNPGTTVAADNAPMRHLVWLRHVADPVADDEAEIRRVIADFDSVDALFRAPAAESGDGAAAGGGAPAGGGVPSGGGAPASGTSATAEAPARAVEWARGIKAAQAALPPDLTALTAVPEPLRAVAADVEALKDVLLHFFTYRANGTRYSRWSGSGRDASNPAHLTGDYKQENVLEVVLERERVYMYAVVPESLFAGTGALDPSVFREVIIRFDETGVEERPYSLSTVHTTRWRRNAAPHEDFVFFYTQAGAGIQFARELQAKMSARLIAFLGAVETVTGEPRVELFRRSVHVRTDTPEPQLQLITVIDPPEAPLPAFAEGEADGAVRSVQLPLDKLTEFLAIPAVRHVEVLPPATKFNDLARTAVRYPDLDTKIAAAKRGGAGVVVGIIDTGIDGSHPAFAGRIHAVWDQGVGAELGGLTGKHPKANHPTGKAYDGMNWGVELTRTTSPQTVANARDTDGHGTHVAGTAAGAEVRDASGNVTVPAGLAPRATIVAVRCITMSQGNFLLAARYIFQKATELSLPCVINMSFGHHFHPHDGSDVSARELFRQISNANKTYRPGRIIVASAGNQRRFPMHVQRQLPANSTRVIGTVQIGAKLAEDEVHIWVRNPVNQCPVSYPLDLYVHRVTTPPSTHVTRVIRLGTSTTQANPAGTFPTVRTIIGIESVLSDVVNNDFHFLVKFSTTHMPTATAPGLAMAQARWALTLVNGSARALEVHAWAPSFQNTGTGFPDFQPSDDKYLVGTPADSAAAISVAASNTRLTWTAPPPAGAQTEAGVLGDLAVFSSPGPLRESNIPASRFYGVTHEINGVDVTAPGCMIQSARSAQATPRPESIINAQSYVEAGTSMASPVLTGVVANLLADQPTLTLPQALALLKNASSIPAASTFHRPAAAAGAKPLSRDWGYGLVNAGLLKP